MEVFMKVTPIDIAHKKFNRNMMGFDPTEVTEFLQLISSQMEALIYERNHLKEILREKELSLLDFKEKDKALKETMSAASQMSDKMRTDAEREAKIILADAQQKSDIIVRDARDSIKKLYTEINDLKKSRIQFEASLRAVIQAHLTVLEQGEKYLPSQAPLTDRGL